MQVKDTWDEVQSGNCSEIKRKALKNFIEIRALFLKEQDFNWSLSFSTSKQCYLNIYNYYVQFSCFKVSPWLMRATEMY